MMNHLEFREQYTRLWKVHPRIFADQDKEDSVWNHVNDLSAEWFKRTVDSIVNSNDPGHSRFDIELLANAERRAQVSKKFADEVANQNVDPDGFPIAGLDKTLEKYQSGSLVEAVEKSRKGEV